jgi:beta-glucosidase
MPVSVPRTVGQIPAFYNYKPTARRGYAFDDVSPLYPFGFGLSYTTFDISDPVLDMAEITAGDTANVSVDVTNTGAVTGDEVVQLYIRDKVSSVTRPVKELKGFKRITLEPGETQTVTLPITPEAMQFYNLEMKRVIEPGEFDIMVGNSSDNVKSTILTVK